MVAWNQIIFSVCDKYNFKTLKDRSLNLNWHYNIKLHNQDRTIFDNILLIFDTENNKEIIKTHQSEILSLIA